MNQKKLVNYDYDENLDNALYSSNNTKDERINVVNKFMNELNLYIQFKKYLVNYFESNHDLKNKIKYIVANSVIPIKDKRELLSSFFKDFLKNIVNNIENTNIDKCFNVNKVKCGKKKGCSYVPEKEISLDLDDSKLKLNVGKCVMNINSNLFEKFTTFIVEELILSNSKSLLKIQNLNTKFSFANNINSVLLTEIEYENLIDKILFQMKNKYFNYNYYDYLYLEDSKKIINYNNILNKFSKFLKFKILKNDEKQTPVDS